jgi:hypothetical protein
MFGQIVTVAVPVTTVGGAGVATGQADSIPVTGFLLDIWLAFGAAPATTDTTISYTLQGGTIAVFTNVNTSQMFSPRRQNVDNSGALVAGSYDYFPLNGPVRVAVAQCDPLAPALTAHLRVLIP